MKTKTEIMVQVAQHNAEIFGEQYGGAIISAREVEMDNVEFTMLVDEGELEQIKELQEDGVYIMAMPTVMIEAHVENIVRFDGTLRTLTVGDLARHFADLAARVGDAAPVFVSFGNGKLHEVDETMIYDDNIINF